MPRSRAPGTCTRELTMRKPGATTAFTPIPATWSIATATPTGTGLHHRNGSRHPAQQSSRNQDTARSTNPISRECDSRPQSRWDQIWTIGRSPKEWPPLGRVGRLMRSSGPRIAAINSASPQSRQVSLGSPEASEAPCSCLGCEHPPGIDANIHRPRCRRPPAAVETNQSSPHSRHRRGLKSQLRPPVTSPLAGDNGSATTDRRPPPTARRRELGRPSDR